MIILLSNKIKESENFTIISKEIKKDALIDYIIDTQSCGLIIDTDFPTAKQLVHELKTENQIFPLIVWGDDFEKYPKLNPFHCVDKLDTQVINNINQLASNYKNKTQESKTKLVELSQKEVDVEDEIKMTDLQSYLKAAVWRYEEIEIPKIINQKMKELLDLVNKIKDSTN